MDWRAYVRSSNYDTPNFVAAQSLLKCVARLRIHRAKGEPEFLLHHAAQGHGGLDGNRIGAASRQALGQIMNTAMKSPCALEISRGNRHDQ